MWNNNWERIFHPVVQRKILLCIFLLTSFFSRWKWKLICIFWIVVLLCLIFFLLQTKKSYIKIQEQHLIVWWLSIPSFKTTEKFVEYTNIENITLLCWYSKSIHIKEKNQEKKTAIDWFSKESFNEIKNILIWKWLPVSVSTMKGTKRETEDFNKNS